LASSRRRAGSAQLAPDARVRLAQVRHRVRAAARRGDTEIVVPGVSAIDQSLCAEGFTVTPVADEDGPYAVVAW
jgi:hypothetical protein